MAKGDDAIRKKLRKDDRSSSSVNLIVALQGMCFSLPTLEDPFNDRNGKKDPHRDEAEFLREKCKEIMRKNEKAKNPGLKNMKVTSMKNEQKKSSIDSAVQKSRIDSVKTKAQLRLPIQDEEGPSATSPFLLFLVASQEKAAKIRSVCKPLKVLGIHTVSIHPGASLDHQIQGLKSSEPEFMISTPERLLELLSLKAIDLSGVSWLMVDGLESFHKQGYFDKVNSIRNYISRTSCTVVFDDCLRRACIPVVQTLPIGSVHSLFTA
ncbi:hypothetical protein ACLB2K_077239 [Fragaria x ananassa]